MTNLGLAISNWDGVERVHLYDMEQDFMQARTLCGKGILGWKKQSLGESVISCKRCSKKFCMICGRPSPFSVCDRCCM